MKLPVPLSFDWDKGNSEKNWIKHKVYFRECEQVFLNEPIKIHVDEGHLDTEERYLAFGKTDKGRKLTIAFVIRNHKIRVISARDQDRKERRSYEKI